MAWLRIHDRHDYLVEDYHGPCVACPRWGTALWFVNYKFGVCGDCAVRWSGQLLIEYVINWCDGGVAVPMNWHGSTDDVINDLLDYTESYAGSRR